MSKGHYHDMSAGTQNQGNKLGDRSCIRQSRLYREYESGNNVKDLLGTSNLKWNPNKKEGVYEGHQVFDHQNQHKHPTSVPPYGLSNSPNRKPLGDIYSANNYDNSYTSNKTTNDGNGRNDSNNDYHSNQSNSGSTARERYEEYLRSMDLKTSSQPQSRSVIGYDDVRQNAEPSSHYGNNLDDANYYRSDFKHPTESHSHSTYKAQTSPSYRDDIQQSYERDDPTNAYSAYNASKAGGRVSSIAGGQSNGGTQNNGNFIGDRSSTRLWAPPGGRSSFSIAHDSSSQSHEDQQPRSTRRMESTGRSNFNLAHNENSYGADIVESSTEADADIGFGSRRRSFKQPGWSRSSNSLISHDLGPDKHAVRSGIRSTAPSYGTGLGLPSTIPRQAPIRGGGGAYPQDSSTTQYGNNLDDANYYRSDFKHPTESHSHSVYHPHPSTGDDSNDQRQRLGDDYLDPATQEALVREAELKLKSYASALSPSRDNSNDNDIQQSYERDDPTNAYSAYNASKAGGRVSSIAGGQSNGGTQNNGNFIGDRSSTRLWAPPGGRSSFSIAHDSSSQPYEDQQPRSTRRMESSYPKSNDMNGTRAYVANAPGRQGSFSLVHDEGPDKHATYNDPTRSIRYKQQSISSLKPPSTDINIRENQTERNKFPTQSYTREDKIALAMLEEGVIPKTFKSTRDGKHFSRQSTRPW